MHRSSNRLFWSHLHIRLVERCEHPGGHDKVRREKKGPYSTQQPFQYTHIFEPWTRFMGKKGVETEAPAQHAQEEGDQRRQGPLAPAYDLGCR